MATLAELAEDNPNLQSQSDEWRSARSANGEDPDDWGAFREHLMAIGAPDPGDEVPEDWA
jgi:hypothetical protein